MEAGLIIGNQIIIMFIILIVGAFCYLKGIITKDGTKQLSSFALNIINPVLIFMSYQSKYDKTLVHGLLWSFLLSAISYAVTILLTYGVSWRWVVLGFALTFVLVIVPPVCSITPR